MTVAKIFKFCLYSTCRLEKIKRYAIENMFDNATKRKKLNNYIANGILLFPEKSLYIVVLTARPTTGSYGQS